MECVISLTLLAMSIMESTGDIAHTVTPKSIWAKGVHVWAGPVLISTSLLLAEVQHLCPWRHLFAVALPRCRCLGMNLVYAEVKLLLSLLVRDYNWVFEDPAVLHKMVVFPQMKAASGSDTLHITHRKWN